MLDFSSPFFYPHYLIMNIISSFFKKNVDLLLDGGSATVHGTNGKQSQYLMALKNLCDAGIVQVCSFLLFFSSLVCVCVCSCSLSLIYNFIDSPIHHLSMFVAVIQHNMNTRFC